MLERYKLRLNDGTVLVVDHDALSSWLVDGRAMVQPVGSERWQSLKAFLAKERVEARSAAWRNPAPETPVPVTPPRPRDDERAFRPVRIPPLPPISEPPSVPVPTDEAPVPSFEPASLLPTRDEEVSITVPVAEELEAPPFPDLASASSAPEPPPAADEPPEVWVPSEEAAALYSESFPPAPENAPSVVPLKLLDEEDVTPWRTAPAMRGAPAEPPPSLNPRSLQVLAEETPGPRGRGRQPRSESTQGLPIIGLKPLAHEDEASFRAALQPETYETYEEGQREERAPLLESSFLGLSPTWDARLKGWFDLLSRGLSLVGRGIDRLTPPARPSPPALTMTPPVRPFAEEPAAPRSVARPAADVANAIAGAASRGRALFARFRGVASAWAYRVRGWVERYTRRDPSGPSLSFDDAPGAGTPGAALRKPLMPPPQINELPVLRLKADDSESERVDHDVYEGSASLGVAWLWLKRAALIAGLLAGGIVAAGTWETWVPAAARFGRAIVLEIDRRAHQSASSREREGAQPGGDALAPATEQLPHLAPQTITLVMSSSVTGVLDPPEVFARAYDAAERGMSALTPAETQELGALRRAVLAALPAADRQRLREYDLLRARRAPLPTENREVLRSFARGARALPTFARERLQELFGKAIAAELARSSDVAARATTAP